MKIKGNVKVYKYEFEISAYYPPTMRLIDIETYLHDDFLRKYPKSAIPTPVRNPMERANFMMSMFFDGAFMYIARWEIIP